MKTAFIIVVSITLSAAWSGAKAQSNLDRYVQEGLANNVVLKQKDISLEKALLSLQIASSYFSPTVGLQGNYTSGEGGRTIAIPVGDLLNPVYRSLNQLTGSEQFPQIANVKQNFFPHNFYDGKVHTSMPLINTDLIFNRRVAQQQVLLQEFEVDIYRRELVRNIKVAWYNYMSAIESRRIFESALARSEEGKRVNESLLANGKGVPAYVLRSESEIETVLSQLADATRQIENARLYFNFLLNRSGNDEISADSDFDNSSPELLPQSSDSVMVENREEIKMLHTNIELSKNLLESGRYFWVPKVSGFLDLGSQAQNWEVNQQSKYYLIGIQMDIPLFAGFRNRSRIKAAQFDKRSSELNLVNNQQQIEIAAQVARNNLLTARQNFQSAKKQFQASKSYQHLIDKGYKEGVNTFIEAVDARNQLTQAQLQVTLTHYRILSAAAQYERETASYTFASTIK